MKLKTRHVPYNNINKYYLVIGTQIFFDFIFKDMYIYKSSISIIKAN
jgi:hypothetical protein